MNQAASESRPETDAALLAQGVAEQLVGRVAFRRAMRRCRPDRDAFGRPGRPGRRPAAGSVAPRWAAVSGTARAACRCTRSAPRSTTARPRPRPRSASIGVKVWVYHGDEVPRPRAGRPSVRSRALGWARPARRRVRSGRRQPPRRRPHRPCATVAERQPPASSRGGGPAVEAPAVETPSRRGAGRRSGSRRRRGGRTEPRSAEAAGRRRPTPAGRGRLMLAPKKVKHRKRTVAIAAAWPRAAPRSSSATTAWWRSSPRGSRTGRSSRPVSRSRATSAWRQGLDQHLPGQARHEEARRDPHGLGQGQPGGLGRRRQARPRDVRAGRVCRSRLAREAMSRAQHKLPIKTKFISRVGD